ncbi:MAG: hypothetical protein ACR2JC_11275 [Chloroflexota bacterium]|nr:MAG: hypothetical protein DLM70_00805 [Chloroflexota bacterium]
MPVATSETAVAYLKRRGIPEHLATEAGVRFIHLREGQSAVLFPMRDESGCFIAAHARSIVDDRKKTRGPKKICVFATPAAVNADVFAVTEGPIDALSLALAGLSTIAHGSSTLRRRSIQTMSRQETTASIRIRLGMQPSHSS